LAAELNRYVFVAGTPSNDRFLEGSLQVQAAMSLEAGSPTTLKWR
jgi:hypothetical protein